MCPLPCHTYRNQLAFIDIFFKGMNNTNYNMAVCGTSGAGKTGLIQPLIRSVLDSGGFAVVFDMGDGYKSLCENMGGVYLDGETLRFNPFANITDIDQSAERVRDQLSVMASPNGNLDEVHEGLLLQAVRASWLAKKKQARIDDVVDFLKNARDNDQYVESPTIRSRLDEMIVLLDQYTANGTYGQYFNSDEPSLRDDAKMVVLELGGLEDRPSLLVAVMFSLIIYIENRMYRTPRNLKKLNVIDEGWRLLDFKNHKVGEFIEKGYRTARRHTGAYITITQNIVDFDSDKASSAARAAWGNSSYKIILKQSAKEFAKYNQLYPDQSQPLQRDMIGKFGAAKDQWFSSFLLQAVRASWLAKENRARIDDVVDFLKNARDNDQYVESPTIRSRLDEMIVLLDQYTANGTYGRYFNSDEPSLRDDAKMVVLELGGLEDRPSLLVAVMFSLIIYIENRMYRTPRNLKKLNVIDEGWRLLDFKNRKVGEFIQKGYRTCRRHTGAYITITQNIVDFDSDKASSAARAAWGNSSYKIILKQSAKEFAKYNQLFPDQFQPLQRDMIGKFGAAKDQWFSSFLLQVENHSSWHRLFVDPLSRAMYSSDGPDFEFVQQKRREGMSIHEAVWQLAWKKSGPEMASLEAWLEEHEKYRSVA
ncbi:conjugal transfer ATP-binding protein TraC [Shigella sonnei]|nr:conjugal transfer ATP-binding protein TraC [Shigella sonnei]